MISSSNFVAIARLVSSGQLFSFHASTNWTSKIPHQKAFIYDIDVSDIVNIYRRNVEIVRLKFPQVNSTFAVYLLRHSFCYCSFLISKFCFEHSVVSPKKK